MMLADVRLYLELRNSETDLSRRRMVKTKHVQSINTKLLTLLEKILLTQLSYLSLSVKHREEYKHLHNPCMHLNTEQQLPLEVC